MDEAFLRKLSEEEEEEEGRKKSRNPDTVRYVKRKLRDKGMYRLDRHPADGLRSHAPPKAGHGGKYTWEGPDDVVESELDPNYALPAQEEDKAADDDELVVGKVEVAKVAEAKAGVSRIELQPPLLLHQP